MLAGFACPVAAGRGPRCRPGRPGGRFAGRTWPAGPGWRSSGPSSRREWRRAVPPSPWSTSPTCPGAPLAPLPIEQRLGDTPIRAWLPRLRRGEQGLRTYRLPTWRRGVYEIGPVEIARADPFGLCRTVQRLGWPQRIAVHPRLLALHPLPAGISRHLEGPSSDASPQGSVTFHRLREYVVGDDLRLVHWPSTARVGKLVVRHNVDTAQPYTVVLADLQPERYSAETFEEAVDVTASLVMSMSAGQAPVQLRLTNGDRLGGPSHRDPTPLIDYLTEVQPEPDGSLEAQLVLLQKGPGRHRPGRGDGASSTSTACP